MGLLIFGFYLAVSLAAISLNPAKYRELVLNVTQEAATKNPDPQVQQMLQWFATPDGLIVFTAIFLAFILVIALVVGMGSGALAVALGKPETGLNCDGWRIAPPSDIMRCL